MESLFSPLPPIGRSTTPPNGPMTDFDIIEAQKENIRPTPAGRSAATLSTLLDKDAVAEQKIQEGHERFRRQIAEAERRELEGEDMEDGVLDVLDVHNRYVAYNVEHHPTSSNHLIPLLENTTRKFVADERYNQDLRHLKLWVQYVRLIERREEVWAFLESRDIGTKHSLFYEEWAMALESLGRKKKADEVFKLGIARKAQPLEKLKARHTSFLERIMAINGQIPEDEPIQPSVLSRTPARAILGQSAIAGPSSVVGAVQLAPSLRTSTKNNGSRMAIFADDGAAGPGEAGESSEWADFGTRDGRRKENVVEATAWRGETMPQSAAKLRIAPRTPKIEVFKEVTDVDNTAIRPADNIFSRSRQPPTEAELIKSDPLRYYNLSTAPDVPAPSMPPPPSTRKPPRPKTGSSGFRPTTWEFPTDGPETKDSKGRVKERRVFDWEQVYRHGEEWSFEEVRARQRGLLGKEWRGEVQAWEMAWHAPGASTPKKEEKKAKPPSPTVNTKLANREIAAMFDQTIHGGKVRDSDSESSDSDTDDDDLDRPLPVTATPLPSRPMALSMPMPTPLHSAVPPTPTPASHAPANGRLNIFADENNVPPSAAKTRLNVFAETPARTPLTARVAEGSAKRAGFGIFTDVEAVAGVPETPSVSRAPLGNNPFATPAMRPAAPRPMGVSTILEETDEAEEGTEEVPVPEPSEEEYEQEYEDEEEAPRRRGGRIAAFALMTPITERTCEYTSHTQFSRSSLSASQLGQSTRSVPAVAEEDENTPPPPTLNDENVMPPREARADRSSTASYEPETTEAYIDTTSPIRSEFDRSGSVDHPFKMPEGFTIHGSGSGGLVDQFDQSMAITDRPNTARFPLIPSSPAGENDTEETGQYVTATAGYLSDLPNANEGLQGDLDLPNPCNPVDETIISTLLTRIDPPLSSLPGFVDCRSETFGRLSTLQKHSKAKLRRASQTSRTSTTGGDDGLELDLAGRAYEVVDKIGEGGFGAVFLAIDLKKREEADNASESEDGEGEEENFTVAIKVESPPSIWEAVILDRIHNRLPTHLASNIVRPRELYAFADESYLLLEYSSQGTLLDVVNKSTQLSIAPATPGAPPAVDELLAIFFTIETLRLVEGLHTAGFIHGDLKIDNCLVRLDGLANGEVWNPQYSAAGDGGWGKKGVRLIDFGRAVDMRLFPAGERQRFLADWPFDQRDCQEMREGKEWSYQTDYAGLVSVAYCLLFGKYVQTEMGQDGRCRISTPLKRYWQTEIWTELFDTLLNSTTVRPDQTLPITSELGVIRAKFESWLEENCQKGGKNLRGMLKKIEAAAMLNKRI